MVLLNESNLGLEHIVNNEYRQWNIRNAKSFKDAQVITLKFYKNLPLKDSENEFNKFIKKLNKLVYKNAYIRYGKQLNYVCVSEGDRSTKRHIHLTIDKPNWLWSLKFKSHVQHLWTYVERNGEVHFGYGEDEETAYSKYQLKNKTKDLVNYSFNEHILL